MAKYSLALVIERYFEFGGLQRDMRRLARACTAAGHGVKVFTSTWDGPAEQSFEVEIVDFRAWSNHGTAKKIENFVASLRHSGEFDCIVGFNRVPGLDVYFCGDTCLKAKLERNNRLWFGFLPRYGTYLRMEEAVFGPTSDTEIMVLSWIELDNIQRFYNTPSERIHLLPPGIDRDRLTAAPLEGERKSRFRSEFGIQDDDLMVLTVGSSFRTKGIDRSTHAIAGLPDDLRKRCHYVVVGLGKSSEFGAIARKAGIGELVSFAGGREDVSDFYYAADLLIHAARTENTGTTLLEAMVTGLPVIATENCGYARCIDEAKGGRVCPEPFVQEQLNEILCDVLADDQARRQYGKNGRDYCETADIYSMIDEGVRVIVERAEANRGGK